MLGLAPARPSPSPGPSLLYVLYTRGYVTGQHVRRRGLLIPLRDHAKISRMKPREEDIETVAQEEVRRLMDLLRTVIRVLGYTNRDIERRAKLNHATTVRNFQGQGEPKLEFILKAVKAIGLEYWEFFELAYGDRPESNTPAGERINTILGGIKPRKPFRWRPEEADKLPASRTAEAQAPLVRQDVDKMLEELRQEVRELFEEHAQRQAAILQKPEKSSSKPKKRNGGR